MEWNGTEAFRNLLMRLTAASKRAMREFDFAKSGYQLDTAQGRVFYFYHDCKRYWKYVRPVKKA